MPEGLSQIYPVRSAIAIWQSLVDKDLENTDLLFNLTNALSSAHRYEEARQQKQIRANILHARFKGQNLASLLASVLPDPAAIALYAPPVIQKAWRLADRGTWSWKDWSCGEAWGRQAFKTMRDFALTYPEQRDQMLDLLETDMDKLFTDAGLPGTGAILVVSHFGPFPAFAQYLAGRTDVRIFGGSTFNEAVAPIGEAVYNKLDRQNPKASLLAIQKLVNEGYVITMAGDSNGASVNATRTLPFLNGTAQFSTLPAKLAYRNRKPIFSITCEWVGEKIRIGANPAPHPSLFETEREWISVWGAHYLNDIAKLVQGDPRNLNCEMGFFKKMTESKSAARTKAA